jgi:hypothetical protein
MSQPIVINIGAIPNDGTGDPLRTAFNDVNLNFANVFAAGLVGSNVQIANNTILTTNTNGNLVLAPNGIGVVQSNVSIVPNTANIRNLGSATQRWATVYTQYVNSTQINLSGDLSVGGNLIVTGNIVEMGNIVTDSLTIQLANTAATANSASGAGITVGANDNIATLLYNSTGNTWTTNIGLSSVGNITAPYFIGNGSQLSGISSNKIYNGNSWANIDTVDGNLVVNVNGPAWSFNSDGSLSLPYGTVTGMGNIKGPGNISYPFGPGPIVLGNIDASNGSAYFSLTAVANASGVLGYAGMASFGSNSAVGLIETTDGAGNYHDWYFNQDGTTTFPAYTFPNVDGATTQVLSTYGNGAIYWANTVNTGNIGFIGDAIYDINGIYLENADLTHGATAAVIIPANGDGNAIQVNNTYGNIVLQAGVASNIIGAWAFDNTGVLNVPLSVNGASNQIKYGMGNLVAYLDGEWTIGEYNGTDFGTTGIRVSPGVEGSAELTLPANQLANVNPASLSNYAGNVVVNTANAHQWKFSADGSVTLPSAFGPGSGAGFIQTTNAYPTLMAYGSSGHGGPELDWTNSDDVGNSFGNSSILRNTMYLNGDGLYIGINETGNVDVPAPNWLFTPTGNLNLPTRGHIGAAGIKGDGTMLTGGNGQITSLTSYYSSGLYSSCSTANPNGTLNITTYGDGTGVAGQWTLTGANLLLAPTNVSGNQGESALFVGTRRVVNGVYSGAQAAYSAVLAAGGTPSVAYTASNQYVQSVKITFVTQSSGSGFNWEQFDVVAVRSQDVVGEVNLVVSNRVKALSTVGDTQVSATINGGGQIEISLTLDPAQNSGGTSSFDAVEFGLMVD